MELLNFNKANCKHCYKCLRVCPVKAIKFKNDQANIVEERCIACGHCFIACPQNARKVKSDLESIKEAIHEGKKVVATVAPSYVGAFDLDKVEQMVYALKKLGFDVVEETAIGADVVASLYTQNINYENYKNIITTACPSSNFLIEKYFPSLIDYMLPIVSPMIAHGKMLKHAYGMDSYVIFIGPCIAKKVEANEPQHNDIIDAVMTFEELDNWFKEENIDLKNMKYAPFDNDSTGRGRRFPIEAGVLKSFITDDIKNCYDVININGVEDCIEILETLDNENVDGVCVELNACRGGCVNGPGMPKNDIKPYIRYKRVKDYVENETMNYSFEPVKIPEDIVFNKTFIDKTFYRPRASEEDIQNILRSLEKFSPEDELNCSACGYRTCREKAQAVYEGMAEISMCMPYMKSKAERLSNHIFENSPNAIFVIDRDLKVVEFNPVCEKMFRIKAEDIVENSISTIIDDEIFIKVRENKENVILQKVSYEQYGVVLLLNIIYIENEDAMLVIMTDITDEEKNKEELAKVKENTLNAAQNVIEKQMIVAQEIAGLLGETTAETKVILTKLKELILQEDGDID